MFTEKKSQATQKITKKKDCKASCQSDIPSTILCEMRQED